MIGWGATSVSKLEAKVQDRNESQDRSCQDFQSTHRDQNSDCGRDVKRQKNSAPGVEMWAAKLEQQQQATALWGAKTGGREWTETY